MSWYVALLIFAIVMIVIERNRTVRGLRHGQGEQDDREQHPSHHEAETEQELRELRERVKVLERITVDGREARAIAEEIEELRKK
uniref:hypothetical protein n=1 Tax=Parerythrobacter lutipelagi TaxID=1964208 RepID=UPI0010F66B80|nr:hypothetical protein [Parerythrobacter lutipelagi]